jgi:hypothetical protein
MTPLVALLSLLVGIAIGEAIYLVGRHRGWWDAT